MPRPAHIALRRLANQHLCSNPLPSAVDVVRALGAVQAQDYGSAKWGLARRTSGLTDDDVEQAFTSGAILRTHVLRPTWHFVLPSDVRWMLELTAPRVRASMSYNNRALALDRATFRRANAALERALRDGSQMTRSELARVLTRARVRAPTGQHVGHLLLGAELDCVIISGGRRGKQLTYALFDARAPHAPARDRDDALRELSHRYFRTRAPATLHDFAWWSGLTVTDAKRAVEINGPTLAREVIGEREYWRDAALEDSRACSPQAHLLPNYDELFVGFRDRDAFAERLRRQNPRARVDALLGHMLFIDGQIVGGWRRTLAKHVDVEVRLPAALTPAEEELVAREVERFGAFLGAPARVRYRKGAVALNAATPRR